MTAFPNGPPPGYGPPLLPPPPSPSGAPPSPRSHLRRNLLAAALVLALVGLFVAGLLAPPTGTFALDTTPAPVGAPAGSTRTTAGLQTRMLEPGGTWVRVRTKLEEYSAHGERSFATRGAAAFWYDSQQRFLTVYTGDLRHPEQGGAAEQGASYLGLSGVHLLPDGAETGTRGSGTLVQTGAVEQVGSLVEFVLVTGLTTDEEMSALLDQQARDLQ